MDFRSQSKHVEDFIRKNKNTANTKQAKLISITSGKGGVGKSNFILNLAISLSIKNKKVLLIDADMNLSNIDVLLGIYPEHSVADLLNSDIEPHQLIVNGPKGVDILPAASGSYEVMQNQAKYQQALIQAYQELSDRYDYILIDTGAGISDYTVDFVIKSDKIVIISTPEPTSITDAYAMIKILFYRLRSPDISLVINMAQSEDEGLKIFNKIKMIVQQFLNKSIGYLGHVPLDTKMAEAVRQQKAIMINNPRAKSALSIQQIALKVLQNQP